MCSLNDNAALVFRVSRTHLVVALSSYPVAAAPLAVVWLAPRPGVAGWIAFGILALCFAGLSTASLCHALCSRVEIKECELRYKGMWRSLTIDLARVRSVYPSLGRLVFDVGERRKLTIPDVFQHRERLLRAIEAAVSAGVSR